MMYATTFLVLLTIRITGFQREIIIGYQRTRMVALMAVLAAKLNTCYIQVAE